LTQIKLTTIGDTLKKLHRSGFLRKGPADFSIF